MPQLPDFTALGQAPSGNTGRVSVAYDGAVAPAREIAATAGQEGTGLRAFGKGLADVGAAGLSYANEQAERRTKIEEAGAGASWLTQKADIDDDLKDETDKDALRDAFPARYDTALRTAAGQIQDSSARQMFLLRNQLGVKQGEIAANARADGIQKDEFMAGRDQQMLDLHNAGLKATSDEEKAAIVRQGRDVIDTLADGGYITQQEAVRRKRAWVENFAIASTSMLPPTQRLQALRPVDTGEATRQAMSFFQSQGWTPAQAAGIVGNLLHESGGGLKTDARAAGDGADGSDSIGIGQWNADRSKALQAFAKAKGKDWTDFQTQLEFVQHELTTTESDAADALRKTTDVRGATEAFLGYERPRGFQSGLAGAAGGANRLHQAQGVFANANGTSTAQPSQVASLIPPDRRQAMTDAAEAEIANGLRDDANQRRQVQATVKSLIADDAASVMATGKPLDALTPERVGSVMGKDAQAEFAADRVRGLAYYNATRDFDVLPANQMQMRIDSLRPKAGDVGYVRQQTLYETAARKAATILKARNDDPAAAVDSNPLVQAAREGVDMRQPETMIPLVKARLAAQEQAGIPPGGQIPITKAEATALMAPVVNGLQGTESAALRSIIPWFQRAFGGQADIALEFALEQAKVDAATARIATGMFKKIGLGQKPTQTDQTDLGRAQTTDAMKNAAGVPAPEGGGWPGVGALFDKKYIDEKGFYPVLGEVTGASPVVRAAGNAVGAVGSRVSNAASYVWYGDRSGPDYQNRRPPDAAIVALIQNPSKADDFDALFGKGMAAKVLKEHGAMTAKPDTQTPTQEGRSAGKTSQGQQLDPTQYPAFLSGGEEPTVHDDNGSWVILPPASYDAKGQRATVLDEDAAVAEYERTGRHFGRFKTGDEAFARLDEMRRNKDLHWETRK